MKTTIYTGLFDGKDKAKKIMDSLEISGLMPHQITKHDVSHNKNSTVFLVSVNANDKYDRQKAINIFDFYKAHKVYELDEILSEEEMKKIVSAHANRHVKGNFEVNHHFPYHNKGISSEVNFGK